MDEEVSIIVTSDRMTDHRDVRYNDTGISSQISVLNFATLDFIFE